MSRLFKRLAANTAGRDFVIGDIHGAYDLVLEGMRQVGFNGDCDRLLVVGDLIDRGPGSERVLKFLSQPYVHAIRGNHDHDFGRIDLAGIRILAGLNWDGLGWAAEVADDTLIAIQQELSKLPIAMEVETARGNVGLVHADIPRGMGWQQFVAAIEQGDEAVIEVALRGRDRLKSRNDEGVPGIGRVYVGHTIQWDGPRALGNVYALDTGAVFRELGKDKGSLTMVDIAFKSGILMPAAGRPVISYTETAEGPFHSLRERSSGGSQ